MSGVSVRPLEPFMTSSTDGKELSSRRFARCGHRVESASSFLTAIQQWAPASVPSTNTFEVKLQDITERLRILQQKNFFPVKVLDNKNLTPNFKEATNHIGVSFL